MAKTQKLISLSDEVASAMTKASRALGLSGVAYIEQAIVRAIAADSEKVALANQEASEEIARLSESANDLIALANRHDAARAPR